MSNYFSLKWEKAAVWRLKSYCQTGSRKANKHSWVRKTDRDGPKVLMATSRSRIVLIHDDIDTSVICDADSSDHLPKFMVVISDYSDSAWADAQLSSRLQNWMATGIRTLGNFSLHKSLLLLPETDPPHTAFMHTAARWSVLKDSSISSLISESRFQELH